MPMSKEMSDNKWDRFREICYKQALKMLKNSTLAEDAAQEALLLALPHIQADKIKNPAAYLRQITRNYCLEILKTPADVSLSTPIQGRNEGGDFPTLLDLIPAKAESEEKSGMNPFETLKKRDPEKAQGIIKSIDEVDGLFWYKTRLRQHKREGPILFEIRQFIDAARKRLQLSTQGYKKLKRFIILNKKHPNKITWAKTTPPIYKKRGCTGERTVEEEVEWVKFGNNIFWLRLERDFYFLRNHIEEYINKNPALNPRIKYIELYSDLSAISKIKIAPIKLLINVWHRGLKRGRKYGDLGLIKELALYFKKIYENKPQAYLFSGMKDNNSEVIDKNFNTLRKRSLYSRNKSFQKIAKEIYRRSFRPEII